jgi:exodeoxyribonuclease VII large subunit
MRRYSVSALTRELHDLLAARYPVIEVEGEVSNLAVPGSGHAYLTLRDADAVLGAVAWRTTWRALAWRPERGDAVVARGHLGVFGGKGAYQLYVTDIRRAGEGALAAEIARRKARLEAEGLLDPRRKRPLPRFPSVVGVATSLTGAALQDFLKVSGRRFPAARVLVAGCTVQGASAPASVVQAVELLVDDGRAEVIVVTRGGGSKEDLLAFQDEGLARYLALCPVPVVSAVGHQVDTTLCDLVADVVAPTPSAAAETVFPDGDLLRQRADEAGMALAAALARAVRWRRERVAATKARLRHPGQRLVAVRARARELVGRAAGRVRAALDMRRSEVALARVRLDRAMARLMRDARARVGGAAPRLAAPWRPRFAALRARLVDRRDRLQPAVVRLVARRRDRVVAGRAAALALSPEGVLRRGYALVTGPEGVVQRADGVAPGDRVTVRVRVGSFDAVVAAPAGGGQGGGDGVG